MKLNVRLAGIPIEVRPSFLVIVLLLGMTGGIGPSLLAWAALATVAVLVHELGHAGAAIAFGASPRIVLLASGGLTYFQPLGARRHVVVALAGPAAGATMGAVVLVALRLFPGAVPEWVAFQALFVTFGWSLLNLLPVAGLDGRAALESLLTVALGRPAPSAVRVAGAITVVALVVGTLALRLYEVTFMVAWVAGISALPGLGIGSRRRTDGDAELRTGRADRALAWTDTRLATGRPDLATWQVRADALRALTRWPEADETYAAILADHPGDLRAMAGRAAVLVMLGRADEGRTLADEAAARAADGDVEAVHHAYFALYNTGRFADALNLVDRRQAAPDATGMVRDWLETLRALAETTMGRPEDAWPRLERLLRASPDRADLHETAALILVQLGRAEDACRAADRALAGMPDHPELLETSGIARRLAGRPDEARALLVRAASARPSLPRALAELAVVDAQLGRLDEAEAVLAPIPPWLQADGNVLYARACVAMRRGLPAEAAGLIASAERVRPCVGRVARWDPVLAGLPPAVAPAPAPA